MTEHSFGNGFAARLDNFLFLFVIFGVQLGLFDRFQGGSQIGATQEIRSVEVIEGAFAVVLNEGNQFGDDAFNGQERWLGELEQQLRERRYRADPVRRVWLAKPDGGRRPLGIPTIRDRVVQTAAKLVLEPIFEADLEDTAYGYRPA